VTTRRLSLILVTLAVGGGLAWALLAGLGRLLQAPAPGASGDEAPQAANPPPNAPAVPHIKATLYFISEDGRRLVPVEQEVPLGSTPVAQARALVEAQLAATPPPPLVSAIPAGTALRGLFISDRGDVFVDLDPSVHAKHPGGSMLELLTVYTIVNAVLTNLPALQDVQILIGGRETDTLAGHVDLRRPLRRNDPIIAAPDPQVAGPKP